MTLYEVNQSAYSQLPTLSEEEIQDNISPLTEFLERTNGEYYMMLEPTGKYYTLYTYEGTKYYDHLAKEIIEITKFLGEIKAIEIEGDKVEFWITDSTNNCKMYALFNYDEGVIKVG